MVVVVNRARDRRIYREADERNIMYGSLLSDRIRSRCMKRKIVRQNTYKFTI